MYQVPQGASSYVGNILKPLMVLRGEVPTDYEKQWNTSVIEQVSERYDDIMQLYNVFRTP